MIVKEPILKARIRRVPKSFSWIDHRLVRDRHIDRCSISESALYLLLVCVSDDKGLSYYGDKSITARLSMDQETFQKARTGLINHGLIAWQKPIYQVLCLEPVQTVTNRNCSMMGLGDILKAAVEVNHD